MPPFKDIRVVEHKGLTGKKVVEVEFAYCGVGSRYKETGAGRFNAGGFSRGRG